MMGEHQITDLLNVSLDNLKQMLKVGMIVGDPINVGSGVLIPIARVKCGFVSGGMDQKTKKENPENLPFGGATAGTMSLTPIAFVSCVNNEVKVLHLAEDSHILEKTIDSVNDLLNSLINKGNSKKQPFVYTVEKE